MPDDQQSAVSDSDSFNDSRYPCAVNEYASWWRSLTTRPRSIIELIELVNFRDSGLAKPPGKNNI